MRYWLALGKARVDQDRVYYQSHDADGSVQVEMSMPVEFAKDGARGLPDTLDVEVDAIWDED